jgi:TDG/mug DNA glycosylase family protein
MLELREQEAASSKAESHRELDDFLRPGLKLVFVGFNPGERSSQIGHYYAGRGNQFWNLLYESGLIPERLTPENDRRVLEFGIGLTDIVKRWSRSASELCAADYRCGVPSLQEKLARAAPRVVAFNGKGAYESYRRFAPLGPRPLRPVALGEQERRLAGAQVFVLPSTSGLNGSLRRAQKLAYFTRLAELVNQDD